MARTFEEIFGDTAAPPSARTSAPVQQKPAGKRSFEDIFAGSDVPLAPAVQPTGKSLSGKVMNKAIDKVMAPPTPEKEFEGYKTQLLDKIMEKSKKGEDTRDIQASYDILNKAKAPTTLSKRMAFREAQGREQKQAVREGYQGETYLGGLVKAEQGAKEAVAADRQSLESARQQGEDSTGPRAFAEDRMLDVRQMLEPGIAILGKAAEPIFKPISDTANELGKVVGEWGQSHTGAVGRNLSSQNKAIDQKTQELTNKLLLQYHSLSEQDQRRLKNYGFAISDVAQALTSVTGSGKVAPLAKKGATEFGEAALEAVGPIGEKLTAGAAALKKGAVDMIPENPLGKPARVKRLVNERIRELDKLESGNSVIRKSIQKSADRGIDVKKIVAETDLLKDAVDKDGTIRTTQEGGAVSQLDDFIRPQEDVISNALVKEGKTIHISEIEKRLKDAVNNSGIKGGAKVRALKNVDQDIEGYMLEADADGNLPLSTVHDAKVDKYSNVDYMNPETSKVDKTIAKALKEIIEENTESVNVKALNRELSEHYAVLNFLEKLDGKKVAGGRLGKYFSQTVGAVVGSNFGPLGALIGSELGGAIKGRLMSSKFSGTTGKVLEQSAAMKEAIQSSKSLGSRKTNQSKTMSPVKENIENIVSGNKTFSKAATPQTMLTRENVGNWERVRRQSKGLSDKGKEMTIDNELSRQHLLDTPDFEYRLKRAGVSPDEIADRKITIYRATDKSGILDGDYVTPDKSVIEPYFNTRKEAGQKVRVFSEQVDIDDLLIGDEPTDFVYAPATERSVAQLVKPNGEVLFWDIPRGKLADFKRALDESGNGIAGDLMPEGRFHLTSKRRSQMQERGAKYMGPIQIEDIMKY